MTTTCQRVLVAAALDERDATTLAHAARATHVLRCEVLYLAHVTPTINVPALLGESAPPQPVDEDSRSELEATLAEYRSLFPAHLRIELVVAEGSLVPELLRLATQKSADLMCIGRLAAEDDLGGTAASLVRKSPCSTLLVPAQAGGPYERILVPIDFSEVSLESINLGLQFAHATPGASVTILHVYSLPLGHHKSGIPRDRLVEDMRELAERQWNALASRIDFGDVTWEIRFEFGSSVPKTILAVAKDADAQAIIMASHGRTRPAALLLGHAADAVVAHATQPLLCVKKKGHVVNLLRALGELFEISE